MLTVKRLLTVAAIAVLAGCATKQPQMTRAEYLLTTQRTYEGATPDDVFEAAQTLFTLADGDDFRFFHDDRSMTASRPWLVYLVLAAAMGTDTWNVRAEPIDGGVKVSTALTTTSGSVLPMPTTGGDMTAGGMPGMGGNVTGTAIYDVFWARMDFLMGKRDAWMTCDEANARVKSGATWGANEALCNSFNLEDKSPDAGQTSAK